MGSLSPEESAQSLLEGYRHQDIRMEYLLTGAYTKAKYEARKAIESMAEAYRFEFPAAADSKKAARHFMNASFMQDEIENWTKLLSNNVPECCLYIPYRDTVYQLQQDPRWNCVATELEAMCEFSGIDKSYIGPKVEFLKHHGMEDPKYKQFAQQAERIRIMAMGKISEKTAEQLTGYFLRGVQQHDEWNPTEPVDKTILETVLEFHRRVQQERLQDN